jgi:hypothetical protein
LTADYADDIRAAAEILDRRELAQQFINSRVAKVIQVFSSFCN